MQDILLGFGSNLGDRQAALKQGIDHLIRLGGLHELRCSRIYATAPVGVMDQPDFLNLAVRAKCDLSVTQLLRHCKETEKALGRRQRKRWHAREIDIDILLFAQDCVERENLIVPHERMHERRFVLEPAAEIASDMLHPGRGASVGELLLSCPDTSPVRLFVPNDLSPEMSSSQAPEHAQKVGKAST